MICYEVICTIQSYNDLSQGKCPTFLPPDVAIGLSVSVLGKKQNAYSLTHRNVMWQLFEQFHHDISYDSMLF